MKPSKKIPEKLEKIFEYANDPKIHQDIDKLIYDLCTKHSSHDLEQDIIALFEDIVAFFSGRAADFIKLDDMSLDQKELLYTEMNTIINLLKSLKYSADKGVAIKILSKSLIKSFSRSAIKYGYVIDEYQILTKEEQDRIKTEFIKLTLNTFHRKHHQILLEQRKSHSHKYMGPLHKHPAKKNNPSEWLSRS